MSGSVRKRFLIRRIRQQLNALTGTGKRVYSRRLPLSVIRTLSLATLEIFSDDLEQLMIKEKLSNPRS